MSLSSTLFLMGPIRQIKSMFDPSRLFATLVFLTSMAMTLFCAFYVRCLTPPQNVNPDSHWVIILIIFFRSGLTFQCAPFTDPSQLAFLPSTAA